MFVLLVSFVSAQPEYYLPNVSQDECKEVIVKDNYDLRLLILAVGALVLLILDRFKDLYYWWKHEKK